MIEFNNKRAALILIILIILFIRDKDQDATVKTHNSTFLLMRIKGAEYMNKTRKACIVLCLLFFFLPVNVFSEQTCKNDSISVTTPTNRFIDNGDGTVLDKQTGLMWRKCADGNSGSSCDTGVVNTFLWQDALKHVDTVNATPEEKYHNWRLPNIKELESIVEDQCSQPSINLGVFPNTTSSGFWSSTPSKNEPGKAWSVDFSNGGVSVQDMTTQQYVRLVRDIEIR